jgi:hypothetical protein
MELNDIAKSLRHAAYAASPQQNFPQGTLSGYFQTQSAEQYQADLIVRGILGALAYGFEKTLREQVRSTNNRTEKAE